MTRPVLLALAASLALACAPSVAQAPRQEPPGRAVQPQKVLRYAFPVAETGFDPAQISDLYSRTVAANIFEAPLTYDYLARPARVKPQTAEALPDVSDDGKRFVFRIKPGILFADDPAFKGARRELTAADYVYSVKRHYDPKFKSPNLFQLENAGIVGLSELRRKAIADKTPFPYDTEVEGLRSLDRYSFEVKLAKPAPRFYYAFADGAVMGAVAREVIEAYPDKTMEHPVGTGPFRLAQWKRSAKIVLERNPNYRDDPYDEEPAASRSRRGQHHRGGAAAMAGVPQRRTRHDRAPAQRVRIDRHTPQPSGTASGQARRVDGAGAAGGCDVRLFRHGASGGGRLHARTRRAATRAGDGL
jgi:ABC-type transport system substrate-binding protein